MYPKTCLLRHRGQLGGEKYDKHVPRSNIHRGCDRSSLMDVFTFLFSFSALVHLLDSLEYFRNRSTRRDTRIPDDLALPLS